MTWKKSKILNYGVKHPNKIILKYNLENKEELAICFRAQCYKTKAMIAVLVRLLQKQLEPAHVSNESSRGQNQEVFDMQASLPVYK